MAASSALTAPDLVVLALLAEGPRHGYELIVELERREVSDWVNVSSPQVYYSLRKLAQRGLIASVPSEGSGGPERQSYRITSEGEIEMAAALGREGWATERPYQPFVTWLAMAKHTDEATRAQVIAARLNFVNTTIARERHTLKTFGTQHGPMIEEARLMIELTIAQFECERVWLEKVKRLLAPSDNQETE